MYTGARWPAASNGEILTWRDFHIRICNAVRSPEIRDPLCQWQLNLGGANWISELGLADCVPIHRIASVQRIEPP